MPFTASAISPFTLRTAWPTPLPPNASPPSRSSTASNSPVEAPDGTAARPAAPEAKPTSTSTVWLPRLSITCRAWTCWISLTRFDSLSETVGGCAQRQLRVDTARAGERHAVEQQIADALEALVVEPRPDACAELVGARVVVVGPRRRAAQQLTRVQRGRQVLRHVVED